MTSEKDITAEVAQAAALLSAGLPTEEVSKAAELEKAANPFVKEDDEDETEDKKKKDAEAEKAMKSDEMEKAIETAVEKALAPLLAALNGVTKGLEVVDGKINASLAHQSASTAVLVSLKDLTAEGVTVSKASAVTVTQIAEQPAGRKTVELAEVVKSVVAEKVEINMDKLREISKGLETYEWVTLKNEVLSGNYSGLTAGQLETVTIKGDK
jgi:hypothetical protein